jgi:hypothetical protein
MPNEEERLKRNDPLTVIMAQASDEVCSLKLQLSLEIFHMLSPEIPPIAISLFGDSLCCSRVT